MKKINIIVLGLMLVVSACSTDLDQSPSNITSPDSLTDFEGVLNSAYNYQTGSATPMSVMGDFRADNAQFDESPHNSFAAFNGDVASMEGDFFQPMYAALYKSILSANTVIEKSSNARHIGEAKFLRALAYFKLVKVFGDVAVNLSAAPSLIDTSILKRQPAADVYTQIISDLNDAKGALNNDGIPTGRASKIAAQALLGKVYMQMGDYVNAETQLATVVSGAAGAGVALKANFADVFGPGSDLNSEIIYATQISGSIAISDYSGSTFALWSNGGDTKSDEDPITSDLADAFDAAGDVVRKNVTMSVPPLSAYRLGVKYGAAAAEQDFIEIRLADVILLYAEALNENGTAASTVLPLLDDIRTRAGLTSLTGTVSSQADVRTAIANERRLELALEGQRWFDLVRTGSVDAEMGKTINSNYYVFPIPTSEIFASEGVITQNAGY
ncbi:RagB/SusD family nutrient uptake outer membrane protein [Polaribacter sp. SA4-12]|uniref:RagB/SusD family nutrient uptake outer membrane protein n=1 Tax=Polaribacter sp. SA4-12 TaxID=1312072 RepID=UPI000B3C890E|nr:RagB/SusD family nutrient uptake outer membrane protein [Polaribacter sp. SA4-12]ARV16318.1 RagB/SusD family nutrient uptake outer membrane protein [Polaribacter sp. SA4-12]